MLGVGANYEEESVEANELVWKGGDEEIKGG